MNTSSSSTQIIHLFQRPDQSVINYRWLGVAGKEIQPPHIDVYDVRTIHEGENPQNPFGIFFYVVA